MSRLILAHSDGEDGLADYPEELCTSEASFEHHSFAMIMHRRYSQSTFYLRASFPVKGMYWDLVLAAFQRVPVGSLPSSDEELCALLRATPNEWRDACSSRYGPLYKWKQYRHGDEIVLGHKIVIKICRKALTASDDKRALLSKDAERNRINTLRSLLERDFIPRGLPVQYLDNAEFLAELNHRLNTEFRGKVRRGPFFQATCARVLRELGRNFYKIE